MRAALPVILVSLLLLLGACLPALDRAADPPPEITVTALGDPVGAVEASPAPAEAPDAAPSEPEPEPAPAEAEPAPEPEGPPLVPPALAAEARACAARGGTLRPRAPGGALWACIRTTRDAGRPCVTAAQCEGACLARSRTCAPFEPLFGCHEVLDAAGRPQTLCRE